MRKKEFCGLHQYSVTATCTLRLAKAANQRRCKDGDEPVPFQLIGDFWFGTVPAVEAIFTSMNHDLPVRPSIAGIAVSDSPISCKHPVTIVHRDRTEKTAILKRTNTVKLIEIPANNSIVRMGGTIKIGRLK